MTKGKCNLSIQHERGMTENWKVMISVRGTKFAIGAECRTLQDAERLRDDFNAARIVQCVNAHDKLVEALRLALAFVDEQIGVPRVHTQAQIHAALDQAEGV